MNNIIYDEIAMYKEEIDCLVKYLDSKDVCFEWGSGGSTWNYAPHVKEFYSVENNKNWFDTVNNKFKEKNINNATVYFKPHHEFKLDDDLDREAKNLLKLTLNVKVVDGIHYSICRGDIEWHRYIDYINSIKIPNKTFSKVFVDGRARQFCAFRALNYLNDDGILFLHDFNRERYHTVLDYYQKIEECKTLVILKKKSI